MPAIIAIIAQLIPLIPSMTVGVESLIAFIAQIRVAAQQSGEWTPEMETAFVNALLARYTSPAWKPDPK